MEQVVIVDVICILMGCLKGGVFCNVCVEDFFVYLMCSLLVCNLVLEVVVFDDIYWGCVQQMLEQGFNIVCNVVLLVEVLYFVLVVIVNCLCGLFMQVLYDVV